MDKKIFKIFTDGGARGNPGQAAIGFVVIDQNGKELKKHGLCIGVATNNVAEYRAVIEALKFIKEELLKDEEKKQKETNKIRFDFFLDSLLVVNQLMGKYKIKNKNLALLAMEARRLEKEINSEFNYQFVPRQENKIADQLVNLALDHQQ